MRSALARRRGVLLAIVYGSFTRRDFFRDVDVAVWLEDPGEAPRIEVDLANNPMLVWTDRTYGHYDIMTCWSEDGGVTLRDDHIRVNSYTAGADQYWPGIGLFLPDSIKRMDVGWWDQRSDEGDIYYNFNKWWRTDLHIVLHDSLANLGGYITEQLCFSKRQTEQSCHTLACFPY